MVIINKKSWSVPSAELGTINLDKENGFLFLCNL